MDLILYLGAIITGYIVGSAARSKKEKNGLDGKGPDCGHHNPGARYGCENGRQQGDN